MCVCVCVSEQVGEANTEEMIRRGVCGTELQYSYVVACVWLCVCVFAQHVCVFRPAQPASQ